MTRVWTTLGESYYRENSGFNKLQKSSMRLVIPYRKLKQESSCMGNSIEKDLIMVVIGYCYKTNANTYLDLYKKHQDKKPHNVYRVWPRLVFYYNSI